MRSVAGGSSVRKTCERGAKPQNGALAFAFTCSRSDHVGERLIERARGARTGRNEPRSSRYSAPPFITRPDNFTTLAPAARRLN